MEWIYSYNPGARKGHLAVRDPARDQVLAAQFSSNEFTLQCKTTVQ